MTSILNFLKNINILDTDKENINPNTQNNINLDEKRQYIKEQTHNIIQKYIIKHKSLLTEYLKFENNIQFNSEHINQIIELYHKLLFDICIIIQKFIEKIYVSYSINKINSFDENNMKIIMKNIEQFNQILSNVYELTQLKISIGEHNNLPLIYNSNNILKHFKKIQNLLNKYLKNNGFKININSL
jgi:hypothetical protein